MKKTLIKQHIAYNQLYKYSQKYIPIKWLQFFGFRNITSEDIVHVTISWYVPVVLSLVILLFSFFMRWYEDRTIFYLVYIILVACVTLLGGFGIGFITTLLLGGGSFFIFTMLDGQPPIDPNNAVHTGFFIMCGFFISILFSKALRISEIRKLKYKEKIYAQTFIELHSAYLTAKKEIKSRDEFLSIASHELKTPLTTMLLKLQNMIYSIRNVSLANFSIPELMNVLGNAEQQIHSLSSRINDLLNLSQITTGRISLQKKQVDIRIVANQVVENFSELLKQGGYKIEIFAPDSVVGVWDSTMIEQAITNLLSNAIKYGNSKPISISIISTGKLVRFEIRDHGIGISKEEQKVIFDRFQRLKEAGEYSKGLGVGLYITSEIVRAHKGKIDVRSSLGKGTTFCMELPLKEL